MTKTLKRLASNYTVCTFAEDDYTETVVQYFNPTTMETEGFYIVKSWGDGIKDGHYSYE